jgi:hypothetical protein
MLLGHLQTAIARRILDIGNVSKAVADVACGAPAWGSPSSSKAAASTSSRLTRPSEPLLRQSCRLIPSLLARRRANGLPIPGYHRYAIAALCRNELAAVERRRGRLRQRSRSPGQPRRYARRARYRGPFSSQRPTAQTAVTHGEWHSPESDRFCLAG